MTDAGDARSDRRPRSHPPGVPKSPEDAQALLFMRLGAAIAQAQIAEGQAASIYTLVHHREPPRRATLGAKVRQIKEVLPGGYQMVCVRGGLRLKEIDCERDQGRQARPGGA